MTEDQLSRLGTRLREELRDAAGLPPAVHRLRRRRANRLAIRGLAVVALLAGAVVLTPQLLPGTGVTIDPVSPPEDTAEDAARPPQPGIEVTSFDLPVLVQLEIIAVRFNDPSRAIIDLSRGEVTTYPPFSSDLPGDAISGASVLGDGRTAVWQDATVRVFSDGATEPTLVHTPSELINPPEFAPALSVLPHPDGAAIWVVQHGPCCLDEGDGQAELIDIETGQVLRSIPLPPNSSPVVATAGGLLLNTLEFMDTGDGWVGEPGSHEWLLLTEDDTVTPLGAGEVLAATDEDALVLTCTSHEPRLECALDLVDLDSGERRDVAPPTDGEWTVVTGPDVPSDSPAWDATTGDGRALLGLAERNGLAQEPSVSHLVVVDNRTTEASVLATFDGPLPPSSWDRTGRYLVMVDGADLTVLDVTDGSEFTIADLIPPDHHVTGMG